MVKTSELLIEARSTLIERGWCQTIMYDEDDRVCLVGALASAMGGLWDPYQVRETEAGRIIQELTGTCAIWPWNDDDDRTFGDVVDLFDRAIIKAKEREA